MKLTIEQSRLYKLLRAASVVRASLVLDITKFSLFDVEDNTLTVSANNSMLGLNQSIEVGKADNGTILIPTTKFTNFIGSLSEGEVKLSTTKNDKLSVSQGKVRTRLALNPDVDLFLEISRFDDSLESLVVDSLKLKRAISKLVFAASSDESRPILQGIYWNNTMQAIDGFRLSYVSELAYEGDNLIVPASSMAELSKLLPDDSKVEIQQQDNKVLFRFDNVVFTSTLLSGQYPDTTSFYEKEQESVLVLSVSEVVNMLKQAAIFAREVPGNVIKISASDKLAIDIVTAEDTYSNEIEAIQGIEDDYTFGVNCNYFLEALNKVESDTFELKLDTSGGKNPIMIESGNFKHVIMPMSIQGE